MLSFYLLALGLKRKTCGEFLWVSLRKKKPAEISVELRTSSQSHQLCSHKGLPMLFPGGNHLLWGKMSSNKSLEPVSIEHCVQSTVIKLRDQDRGVSPTSRAPFQKHKTCTIPQPSWLCGHVLTLTYLLDIPKIHVLTVRWLPLPNRANKLWWTSWSNWWEIIGTLCPQLHTVLHQLLPLQSRLDFWLQLQGISIAEHLPNIQLPSSIPDRSICMQLQQHFSPTTMHTQSHMVWLPSSSRSLWLRLMFVKISSIPACLFLSHVQEYPAPWWRLSCLGKWKDCVQANDLILPSALASEPSLMLRTVILLTWAFPLSHLLLYLPSLTTLCSPWPHFFNNQLLPSIPVYPPGTLGAWHA